VLTSEAAEKNASVDPQHRITIDDAKGKGLLIESDSSEKPPRSGIVITHQRQQEGWRQRRDRYRKQQEERRREEWNRHKDHWRCPFLFIVGKKVLSYLLLKITQSAMVIMGLIVQKEGFNLVIKVCPSMSRSEVKHQYIIGWGAGSVYMRGLVNALHIFQETKRNLKRW
jgi:hypothetical protein